MYTNTRKFNITKPCVYLFFINLLAWMLLNITFPLIQAILSLKECYTLVEFPLKKYPTVSSFKSTNIICCFGGSILKC